MSDEPVKPVVDMDEYDRQLLEMGFVFEDDPEDDDKKEATTDVTFFELDRRGSDG